MICSIAEKKKLIDRMTLSELDRSDSIRDNIPIISQVSEHNLALEEDRDVSPQIVKSSRRHGHRNQDRRAKL